LDLEGLLGAFRLLRTCDPIAYTDAAACDKDDCPAPAGEEEALRDPTAEPEPEPEADATLGRLPCESFFFEARPPRPRPLGRDPSGGVAIAEDLVRPEIVRPEIVRPDRPARLLLPPVLGTNFLAPSNARPAKNEEDNDEDEDPALCGEEVGDEDASVPLDESVPLDASVLLDDMWVCTEVVSVTADGARAGSHGACT
jgi:hypothetical protein